MMKPILILLLLLGSNITFAQQQPVNKNATKEARRLLQFLYDLEEGYIFAGQHDYNEAPNRYRNKVKEMTGKYPVVWGTDFIWRGKEDPGQDIVQEAIQKHKEGYIVTLMWHAGRPQDNPPFDWKGSIQAEMTDAEWKELTTPGTPLHQRWQKQADAVASHLKQLQDAGVPVLWRPYHEMNGVWFWWGDQKGEDGFVKLWKMMYERYVNHHQLNNLIWVWNANAPRDIPQDEAFAYAGFYPGHDYVDILATDVYHFDYEQKDYNELLNLASGKPIALGEVGQLPKPEILEAQPEWRWFMVWSKWIETHNTPERVKEVYAHPKTLTRDEVEWHKNKK